MNTFKKIFFIIHRIFNNYCLMISACSKISPFLHKGVYKIRKKRIVKGFGIPFLISFGKKKMFHCREIDFYYGGWSSKIVCFCDDKVISFYKHDFSCYIENINRFYEQINYPKSIFYEISMSGFYTITDKTIGQSFCDLDHIVFLAKDIIKKNSNIDFCKDNGLYSILHKNGFARIPYYVQHGDLTYKNVLWMSKMDYSVIDFDTINIYPALYDFFRLVIIDLKLEGLNLFLNEIFDNEILCFMNSHCIDMPLIDFKDSCLASFTLISYKYWFTDKILAGNIPTTYCQTYDVLMRLTESRKS